MSRAAPLALVVVVAACSPRTNLFLERPWPEDQPAILIVTDDTDHAVEAHVVLPLETQRVELSTPPEDGRIYARTYPELPRYVPLEQCSARIGGAGPSLGDAAGAWSSGPIELGRSGSIALVPESSPRAFDVHLEGCAHPAKSCALISRFLPSQPTLSGLNSVVTLSADSALGAGSAHSFTDTRTVIVRVNGETTEQLPAGGAHDRIFGMARHGSLIAGIAFHALYLFDREGSLVSTTTHTIELSGIAAGVDDTLVVIDELGDLFAMATGSNDPMPLPRPDYQAPAGKAPQVAIYDAQRILAAGPDAFLYLFDGSTWRRLPHIDHGVDVLALDSQTIFITQSTGDTLLLPPGSEDWRPLGGQVLTHAASRARALNDGRYIMVGQGGRTSYFNGEELCELPAQTTLNLEDIDFWPGANHGYAVGQNSGPDTPPVIMRFELPE